VSVVVSASVADKLGFLPLLFPAITAATIKNEGSISGSDIGIYNSSVSAALEAAIYQRVYFMLKSGHSIDEYTFELTYINPDKTVSTSTVMPEEEPSKNRFYITIPQISSPNLDYVYTIKVTHNETGETYVVNTSIMRWAKTSLENTAYSIQRHNIARALYFFSQAANAYYGY